MGMGRFPIIIGIGKEFGSLARLTVLNGAVSGADEDRAFCPFARTSVRKIP
jgi:hypothetical protein